jgi:hypothetical protein
MYRNGFLHSNFSLTYYFNLTTEKKSDSKYDWEKKFKVEKYPDSVTFCWLKVVKIECRNAAFFFLLANAKAKAQNCWE